MANVAVVPRSLRTFIEGEVAVVLSTSRELRERLRGYLIAAAQFRERIRSRMRARNVVVARRTEHPFPGSKRGGLERSRSDQAVKAARHMVAGESVLYRQGKATYEAVVARVDSKRGTLLLQRLDDGKKVQRRADKVPVVRRAGR